MTLPQQVRMFEVGPRDGLQNEAVTVPVDIKIGLIERLAAAGLSAVESGRFDGGRLRSSSGTGGRSSSPMPICSPSHSRP